MTADNNRSRREDRFVQSVEAIEYVRHEPSNAEIEARLTQGETLESIAAEIAAARAASVTKRQ